MSGKHFIDTNIFIYSFDSADKNKQDIARKLISESLENHTGITSYQVIQEFINVVEYKLQEKHLSNNLKVILSDYLYPLCNIFADFELFNLSIDIKRRLKFSFYDSLIIAAAKKGGCRIIYTEDLKPMSVDRDLKIINPFLQKS